jgi:hypothetical protein
VSTRAKADVCEVQTHTVKFAGLDADSALFTACSSCEGRGYIMAPTCLAAVGCVWSAALYDLFDICSSVHAETGSAVPRALEPLVKYRRRITEQFVKDAGF